MIVLNLTRLFLDEHPEKLTQRVILSIYSRIFDPFGFIQPFTLQPKLIVLEFCRLGLSWDDKVPMEVSKEWRKWLSGIKDIAKFSFPWCVVRDNTYKSAEMHVFSDASRTTYAVTCFGRFMYDDGMVLLQFLFGKCKLCPASGSLTIPRLELVAASLATRVACSVLGESNVKYGRVIYWSDSAATLHLIRNSTRRFGMFATHA